MWKNTNLASNHKTVITVFKKLIKTLNGFVLFEKLHFHLSYQLGSLAFKLIISWNFSLLSIYYCSSECNGAVWAEQGPKLLRCQHMICRYSLAINYQADTEIARTSGSLVLNPSGRTDCKLPIANMIGSNLASS